MAADRRRSSPGRCATATTRPSWPPSATTWQPSARSTRRTDTRFDAETRRRRGRSSPPHLAWPGCRTIAAYVIVGGVAAGVTLVATPLVRLLGAAAGLGRPARRAARPHPADGRRRRAWPCSSASWRRWPWRGSMDRFDPAVRQQLRAARRGARRHRDVRRRPGRRPQEVDHRDGWPRASPPRPRSRAWWWRAPCSPTSASRCSTSASRSSTW